MPLQNRVTPFGTILAIPERGHWLGNRGGCFHDAERRLKRRHWAGPRWLVCVLEFRGRRRTVMSPGLYTELFFLDEATALAAGHRPCCECRRADYERFKAAWLAGNPDFGLPADAGISAIDAILHEERISHEGRQPTFRAFLSELPDGTFITLDPAPSVALLVAGQKLWRWSPGGYTRARLASQDQEVTVLTPRSMVRTIAAGYRPECHLSVSSSNALAPRNGARMAPGRARSAAE